MLVADSESLSVSSFAFGIPKLSYGGSKMEKEVALVRAVLKVANLIRIRALDESAPRCFLDACFFLFFSYSLGALATEMRK